MNRRTSHYAVAALLVVTGIAAIVSQKFSTRNTDAEGSSAVFAGYLMIAIAIYLFLRGRRS